MAPSITKTLLRRRKTIAAAEGDDSQSILLRELPYEIQLMIAEECVLSAVPVIVGKTISRWTSDPEEQLMARSCSSMLGVSRDFRKELYRLYYENNTFEFGYYYDRSNFFTHPGKEFVQYVVVDALRVLVHPTGVPNSILEKLKLLPNLKQLSIRLRGSLLENSVLYEAGLAKFLVRMSRALPIAKVELLIEPMLVTDGDANQRIQDYRDFLAESLTMKEIWPKGMPQHRTLIRYEVNWETISAAGQQRLAMKMAEKQIKTGKIKTLISGMRRASVASSTISTQS